MLTFLRFVRFSTKKDPYVVLGIARNATLAQIKEAYISLSKIYHPDINQSEDAKERFLDIHQAYNNLKQQHFYDNVHEEFKKNYYSTQSEEECFKQIFGFYFHENPQEYFKPENAQKRADYQELLQKYKFQNKSAQSEQTQYDIKINRTFDPNSIYRNSDHTMIKVVIMASIVLSITGAYVMFYKKKDSLNRNTTTDSQILRMKTLALIRQQKILEEKQQQKI